MSTDFVGRVIRPEANDWIIRSLLDNDFYKFTMGMFIHRFYPDVRVRFRFINRNRGLPLALIIDEAELRAQLDHARTLSFRRTDLAYLRGQNVYHDNMFSEEYLAYLKDYRLPPYQLTRVGDQFEFMTQGKWSDTSPWETIYLAVVSELLYRTLMREMSATELDVMFAAAKNKLYRKLLRLKKEPGISFADFGFRRRFSHLWHKYVLEMCREVMKEQFTGASSVWMAFNQDLVPIGTNAHELPMVLTAIAESDDEKKMAQYEVLRKWGTMFPKGGLRIVLPDTYGSRQFWYHMPIDLAHEVAHDWRGDRLDSGDPIDEALRKIRWYKRMGVDDPFTQGKISIPSDGLDVDPMLKIHMTLAGKIGHPYGWGTMLTNDFIGCNPKGDEMLTVRGVRLPVRWSDVFRGHSLVCKPDQANGQPVVKLSNNILKATGPKEEIARYERIFAPEGRVTEQVFV